MKTKAKFLLFTYLVYLAASKVLLSREAGKAPRRLYDTDHYNEIDEANEYRKTLKALLKRVSNLRQNLADFKVNSARDIAMVKGKIASEANADVYEQVLESIVAKKASG